MRLAVLLLFVLIIGGARWQRQNKDLEVHRPARHQRIDGAGPRVTRGKTLQESIDEWLRYLADEKNGKPRTDRMGVIASTTRRSIDAMPNIRPTLDARADPRRRQRHQHRLGDPARAGDVRQGRDAPAAARCSDGNATIGDCEAAINAAVAAGVQIDVVPLRYNVQNEVVVERLERARDEARERAVHDRRRPAQHQPDAGRRQADRPAPAASRWTWTRTPKGCRRRGRSRS